MSNKIKLQLYWDEHLLLITLKNFKRLIPYFVVKTLKAGILSWSKMFYPYKVNLPIANKNHMHTHPLTVTSLSMAVPEDKHSKLQVT